MNEGPKDPDRPEVMHAIERLISRLLLGGVAVSMATVVLGVVLMFVHHPDYLRSAADLERLTTPGAALPHTWGALTQGLSNARGQPIIALGLILLIATPILRVAVSMVGFAIQRDWTYAAISAVVLVLLVAAFVVGAVG